MFRLNTDGVLLWGAGLCGRRYSRCTHCHEPHGGTVSNQTKSRNTKYLPESVETISQTVIKCKYLQMDGVLLGTLRFYSVFFPFSSTKIGHSRLSVKNRYAISDKNILRSYVVRYFYPKFLACHPSASWEMYKKKEKNVFLGSSLIHFTSYRQLLAHTQRVPGFINLISPVNC